MTKTIKSITTTTTTTTIDEIHSDIIIQILRHLDGRSLTLTNSVTTYLCSLSSNPDLWRRLSLSTWPSLRDPTLLPLLNSSPRQFFHDAYPFPATSSPINNTILPDKLISAVDFYHDNVPIFSCVIETDTSTPWFRESAFLIDAPSAVAIVKPEELTLSWIVIDPTKKRAVNLSSRKAVVVGRRNWCVGETVARFSMVRGGFAVGATVTWRKGRGDVMEAGLTVEDMDGVCVSGMEGLRAVTAAMDAARTGKGEEEAKEMFWEYLKIKKIREERRVKREWLGDMWCAAFAVAGVFYFFSLFVFR